MACGGWPFRPTAFYHEKPVMRPWSGCIAVRCAPWSAGFGVSFGREVNVVDLVGSNGCINGRSEVSEGPPLTFYVRQVRPTSPRWAGGTVGVNKQPARLFPSERYGTSDAPESRANNL